MGYLRGFVPQHPARRWSYILLLAAFCAIPVAAQGAAPAPAVGPQATAVTATVQAPADFLASLSVPPTTGVPPAPGFLQTTGSSCTSDAQCPYGKLCCRDCGYFGCTHMACLTAVNGHCPAIP
ncbi:MAG TPA: hypothetical protein VGH73_21865 [Thermoanaerobaculia bacterium]|jgi:hypothetical protein